MDELIELLTSEKTKQVLHDYLPHIIAALLILAKWVRSKTLHWRLWGPVARVFGFIIEVLDFIHLPKLTPSQADLEKAEATVATLQDPKKRSKITERVNKLKSKQNTKTMDSGNAVIDVVLLVVAFFVALFIFVHFVGCATWYDTTKSVITTAHEAGVIIREQSLPAINATCSASVAICLQQNRADDCPEYEKCEKLRNQVGEALKTFQRTLQTIKQASDGIEEIRRANESNIE